jgi:glycosyltransferase involved in cell wall biosynthesis
MGWTGGRRRAPLSPEKATVSVVIPCYNYGHYLEECLRSVLSQEGVDVRVLIIDDASPDGSAEIARQLAREDSRIDLVAHERNQGHIATFNEGLAQAAGNFSVLLSADDFLAEGALARAVAVFAAYPDVGLVYGRAVSFTDGRDLLAPRGSGRHVVWDGIDWAETRCRVGRVGIHNPEVVVRTKVQQSIGGYRSDLPHSGDSEMWLRFAMQGGIAFVDAVQGYYRVHPDSMSKSRFNTALIDSQARHRAFESAFRTCPDPAEASRLNGQAAKGIAAELLWAICRAYDRGDADIQVVQDLVGYAREIYPATNQLPEYRRLRLRQTAGARRSRRMAPLWLPDLALHRIRQAHQYFGDNWWWHVTS